MLRHPLNSVCICVTWGQLDVQFIPRKLHRCRPVRDSGLAAAAWVCLWGCHSSPYYTYTACICVWASVCVCWDSCLCVTNRGGRTQRDVLAVTSTTGDTPHPTHPCNTNVEMKGPLKLDQTEKKTTTCLHQYFNFVTCVFFFFFKWRVPNANCAFFCHMWIKALLKKNLLY